MISFLEKVRTSNANLKTFNKITNSIMIFFWNYTWSFFKMVR